MATISNNDPGQKLDQLVAEFVRAAQEAVLAAVAKGLAATPSAEATALSSTKSSKPSKRAKSSKSGSAPKPSLRSKRRTEAEVAELGERFYTVLCRHPGATMAVLARKVGSSPRELHLPVALLKRAGRVRSVGQRQWTTYFPMASVVEAAEAA